MNNGMEDKIKEAGLRLLAADRAAADPLPGALENLFLDGAIQAGSQTVRKLRAIDQAIFKIVDSPVYRMMLEAAKPDSIQEEVPYTDEEEWGLCYQFTRPATEVYAVAKQGKEKFYEVATNVIGATLSFGETSFIVSAIMEQIKASGKTHQNFSPAEGENSSPLTQSKPTRRPRLALGHSLPRPLGVSVHMG